MGWEHKKRFLFHTSGEQAINHDYLSYAPHIGEWILAEETDRKSPYITPLTQEVQVPRPNPVRLAHTWRDCL